MGSRVADLLAPKVLILAYHRVTRLDPDAQQLAVRPERFRAQLARLKAALPVVRFEDDWNRLAEPAAVVTFDDGYADNLLEALPILEALEVPATFFVTTGNVESGREFWWDELERLAGTFGPASYGDLHGELKRLDPEQREARMEALRKGTGPGAARASHRPLTVDEVRRLGSSRYATVGAHGVTHTALAALPPPRQREEMAVSRSRLESWLGRPSTVFSFPFGGRRDFTSGTVRLCAEVGFTKAAANVPGCARRWSHPHRLPRHLVRDWEAAEFERRLAEFLRT